MKKIFNKVGLLLIAVVAVGMLGICYAAYTDFLTVETDLTTGSMDFDFHDIECEGAIIGIMCKNGKIKKLDADIEYDGKPLRITDMEAIPMSMIEDGDMELHIRYAMKATEDQRIMRAATIDERDQERNIIGVIP